MLETFYQIRNGKYKNKDALTILREIKSPTLGVVAEDGDGEERRDPTGGVDSSPSWGKEEEKSSFGK